MSYDEAALVAKVRDSYATPGAIAKYSERIDSGLRIWEKTIVREQLPFSGRVLVVGCGAGRETFALQELGYWVAGVDVSAPLVTIALKTARERRLPCVVLLIDGSKLPFRDGSFDAITLWAQMLDNVPTARGRKLLGEVHRVLRTGGTASSSVHDDERTRPQLAPETILTADDPEPGDLYVYDESEDTARYMHYFQPDELSGLCANAGFDGFTIAHTSDLGEAWDNVFVAVCTKARC